MGIKIEWVDPNGENADVKVYRATSPMADNSLPAPLATVVGGVGFYVDDTAVRNQLYYYRLTSLGKAGSNETIITPNKPIAFMPYTGPGPQVLKRGDWESGFFGRMPMGDLFAQSDLINYVGVSCTENVAADNEWLKFVFKGKIIFIPKYPIAGGLKWEDLYRAGAVYGDIPEAEWAAIAKSTFGVVAQKKRITYGEHEFTIRNPTSRLNQSDLSVFTGGEIDQCIAAAARNRVTPDISGRGQFDDYDYPAFLTMTTDLTSGGYGVNRGWSGTGQGVDTVNVTLAATTSHPQHGWRPALVLTL